jgi:hypothetical protein
MFIFFTKITVKTRYLNFYFPCSKVHMQYKTMCLTVYVVKENFTDIGKISSDKLRNQQHIRGSLGCFQVGCLEG